MDEPVADSAFITTHLVSQFASRDVTVILSGVGGDELFGGYRRYLGDHYSQWLNYLPDSLYRKCVLPLANRLPSDRHSPVMNAFRLAKSVIVAHSLSHEERYREYVGVYGNPLLEEVLLQYESSKKDALNRAFQNCPAVDQVNRLMAVDLQTQLPDDLLMLTDKMTMASSIECRVPLLDQSLVDLSLEMPASMKVRGSTMKYVLKKALKDILPENILHRKKRGFGAPMGAWLKGGLLASTQRILSEDVVKARGLFDSSTIQRMIRLHQDNREDYSDHLQALVNLEIYSRIFLDGRSPEDVSRQLLAEGKP